MYVTKVLTDVNEGDVRYSTSTSTSNGRKENGDFESGNTNLKSVHNIGNNAVNAIDLECEEHSLTNNTSGENVLPVDKRITMKREREETVSIENSNELERMKGNESVNEKEKEKMKEGDMDKESEKKKKREGDKENKSKNEIKSESKNESKNEGESERGSGTEKKGVEVKNKAAKESTATVRLSLGLTHTIQPVSIPTD